MKLKNWQDEISQAKAWTLLYVSGFLLSENWKPPSAISLSSGKISSVEVQEFGYLESQSLGVRTHVPPPGSNPCTTRPMKHPQVWTWRSPTIQRGPNAHWQLHIFGPTTGSVAEYFQESLRITAPLMYHLETRMKRRRWSAKAHFVASVMQVSDNVQRRN